MPLNRQFDDTLGPGRPQGSNSTLTFVFTIWERVGLILDAYYGGDSMPKRVIDQDVKNLLDLLPQSHDYGHERGSDESFTCKGPMHWHEETTILCNQDLKDLSELASSISPDYPAKKLLEKLQSFWTSANSLKQLERFVSERQPQLLGRPLPDGSNFLDEAINPDRSAVLGFENFFRIFWTRHLHFPGIFAANYGRAESFAYLYGIGRVLLETELHTCPTQSQEEDHYRLRARDPDGLMVNWIPNSRRIIRQVLEDIAAVAYTKDTDTLRTRFDTINLRQHQHQPHLNPQGLPTREEILRENVFGQPFKTFSKIIARYNELMKSHPFERLIMELLEREDTFERALTIEHVEDKLVNKQITTIDEHYVMSQRFRKYDRGVPYSSTRTMQDMFLRIEKSEEVFQLQDYIYKMTSRIALLNRQRYGFRLMRDWSDQRPWKLIVQPFDTSSPENQWLIAGIHEFDALLRGHKYTGHPFEPSHTRNRACNMFGIIPLDGCVVWPNGFDEDACAICSQCFTPGNSFDHTIVLLRCEENHVFHLKCIFEYWDHPNKYLHSCPTCGQSPALQHEIFDFKPTESSFTDTNNPSFVFNLSDYKTRSLYEEPPLDLPDITKHPLRSAFYDIPSRVPGKKNPYWERENALVEVVEKAPMIWVAGTTRKRVQPLNALEREVWRIANRVGARWQAMNDTGVRAPRWYVPSELYDASRFSHDEEVAVLRKARRRRDRNRRARVRAERTGLLGL